MLTTSVESFTQIVIEELSMKHNTAAANTQVVTYIHCLGDIFLGDCQPGDDFDVNMTPREGFDAALVDLTKKSVALELLPDDGTP